MNDKPKTGRGWRILRRIMIGLAVVATLIAALVTEEDWRGKRAWENYKREWEAKGEKFDWQAFVPPSVPDDQNFFTAPIFTNILNKKIVMSPYGNDGGPSDRPNTNQSGYVIYRTRMADLEQLQNYYRNPTNIHAVVAIVMRNGEGVMTNGAMVKQTNYLNHATDVFPIAPEPQTPAKDVLFALSKFDSAVEDLRQASKRPYANVPLPYEEGISASATTLLPYLAELKRCTQLLQLRAVAELADGQNAKALDDVKLLLYLNNSLHDSPFLISHLVRFAIVAIGVHPIWEGLAKHEWSDAQLAELESELAKNDFLAECGFSMRGERAFSIASIENQRRTRVVISLRSDGSGIITNKFLFFFMPSAYFYQNELSFARTQQQWLLPLVDTNSRIVSPAALHRAENSAHAELKHYSPYTVHAATMFPTLGFFVERFALIQSSIDLARVACALERFRLAHGEYPETLDALAPQFIEKVPHDIINGQPLHYRRTDDPPSPGSGAAGGKFVLYSVGWNEKDDGGTVVFLKGGSTVDRDRGDWVWQYPVK